VKLRRSMHTPIGIDIGSRFIKAVQMRMEDDGPTVARAAAIPRAGGENAFTPGEAARLLNVLWRMDFQGRRIVVAVPPGMLLNSVMELPPRSSGAPLNEIARQELARAHKADSAAIEMSWWELPGGARASEGTHVMAVGCKHADADTLLDAFQAAGGDVIALDAPSLALVRAARSRLAPAPSLTALVDLAWSSAELIIVQGDTIVYERSMRELGLAALVAQVKAKLSVDDDSAQFLVKRVGCGAPLAEGSEVAQSADAQAIIGAHVDAFASELRMSMTYAARRFGAPSSGALLTGGASLIPGLVTRLSDSVEMPVTGVTLANSHKVDDGCFTQGEQASFLTAAGLAMHNGLKAVAA
jgi:Tfp pilus assembly PilM family ATPase